MVMRVRESCRDRIKRIKASDSWKEKGLLAGRIAGISLLVAWLFYDSWIGLVTGIFVGPLFVWEYRQVQKQKYLFALEQQFCTGLMFAAGALEAGDSVEKVWRQMYEEVAALYGRDSMFAKMLDQINRGVSVNQPLERLFLEQARLTESEIMNNFSDVFFFARRSGGNLTLIMRHTAERIRHNFQIREEVQLAIASRKLEITIMNIMPFAILVYLRLGSTGFLEPLYHNPMGTGVMTLCFGIYFLAWFLGNRMVQIGKCG